MNDEARAAVPDRQACVLRYLLESQAKKIPDRIFVRFHGDPHGPTPKRWRRFAAARLRCGAKASSRETACCAGWATAQSC